MRRRRPEGPAPAGKFADDLHVDRVEAYRNGNASDRHGQVLVDTPGTTAVILMHYLHARSSMYGHRNRELNIRTGEFNSIAKVINSFKMNRRK